MTTSKHMKRLDHGMHNLDAARTDVRDIHSHTDSPDALDPYASLCHAHPADDISQCDFEVKRQLATCHLYPGHNSYTMRKRLGDAHAAKKKTHCTLECNARQMPQ
jgi:hypothetical protein